VKAYDARLLRELAHLGDIHTVTASIAAALLHVSAPEARRIIQRLRSAGVLVYDRMDDDELYNRVPTRHRGETSYRTASEYWKIPMPALEYLLEGVRRGFHHQKEEL
jgi:predicted DNA-binding transcriptional regulator YafY